MKQRLLNWLRAWLWEHSSPYFDLPGYMRRRWVFVCPWFSVRIHHILRSDSDRALHDHPFNYGSLILRGGYWEHLADGSRTWYGPGSLRFAKAEQLHRLELPINTTTWSLFFIGKRRRDWGFQTDDGWVDHKKYLEEKHGA